jgi:hypothetical protein
MPAKSLPVMICPLPGSNKEAMKGFKSRFVLQVGPALAHGRSGADFVNSSGNAIMISSTFHI